MPKTLLLADDSVTIRKVVGISFANEDVSLVTVDNGDDAILKARQIKPDAILADVVMPGKSGYEVCETVKSDPELRHIPVLLLTGTFEAFDEERARNAGAAGHVAKPFEASSLVGEVKRLFAAGASPEAAAAPPAAPPQTAPTETAPAATARPSVESFDFDDDLGAPTSPEQETVLVSVDALEDDSASTDAIGLSDTDLLSPDMPTGGTAEAEGTVLLQDPNETGDDLAFGELEPELPGADVQPLGDAAADFLGPDPAPSTGSASPEELMGATSEGLAPPAPSDPLSGNTTQTGFTGQEFDFESTGSSDPLFQDESNLAEATLLDPAAAADFDVSSSDLGDPLAAAPPTVPQETPAWQPEAPAAGHPSIDDLSDDLTQLDPDALLGEPLTASAAPAEPAPIELEPGAAMPTAEPTVLATDLGATAPDPATATANLLADIEPQVRKQLHDTLEKVAWDSFSDVTDKIVREAIKKVEAVAWEVIPQLAEQLVREEIQRMKGESDDAE
jgi:CheY-like chemotaxis protein